jgi:hypothetical protein
VEEREYGDEKLGMGHHNQVKIALEQMGVA